MKNKKSAASSMIGLQHISEVDLPRVRRSTVNLCDVRGSRSCICDRRSDFKYPDRTSVSAVYVDYRHIYLRCGSIWNRPGA